MRRLAATLSLLLVATAGSAGTISVSFTLPRYESVGQVCDPCGIVCHDSLGTRLELGLALAECYVVRAGASDPLLVTAWSATGLEGQALVRQLTLADTTSIALFVVLVDRAGNRSPWSNYLWIDAAGERRTQ